MRVTGMGGLHYYVWWPVSALRTSAEGLRSTASLGPRPPNTERREAWYILYVYLCACAKYLTV